MHFGPTWTTGNWPLQRYLSCCYKSQSSLCSLTISDIQWSLVNAACFLVLTIEILIFVLFGLTNNSTLSFLRPRLEIIASVVPLSAVPVSASNGVSMIYKSIAITTTVNGFTSCVKRIYNSSFELSKDVLNNRSMLNMCKLHTDVICWELFFTDLVCKAIKSWPNKKLTKCFSESFDLLVPVGKIES